MTPLTGSPTAFLIMMLLALPPSAVTATSNVDINSVTQALQSFANDGNGLEMVRIAESTMRAVFKELQEHYKDYADLMVGIERTSLKYQKVHGLALSAVSRVEDMVGSFIIWLPAMTKDKKSALLVLKRFITDLDKTEASFRDYVKAHDVIQDEVEGHRLKATEQAELMKWRRKFIALTKENEHGETVLNDHGKPELELGLDVTTTTFIGTPVLGTATAVAFFAGGPATALALATTTSAVGFVAGVVTKETLLRMENDYNSLRLKLAMVHDVLMNQIKRLRNVKNTITKVVGDTSMLQDLVDHHDKDMLALGISEAAKSLSRLKDECAKYLETQEEKWLEVHRTH